MSRWTTATLTAALLCAAPLTAQDRPGTAKPLGSWLRDLDGVAVRFTFTETQFHCVISSGESRLDVQGDYGLSKDGVLFGRIGKVDKKGIDAGPSAGDLFSFRFEVKDKTLSLSELRGTGSAGDGAAVVEGQYKLVPPEKKKAEK